MGQFRVEVAPNHPDSPQYTSVDGKVSDGLIAGSSLLVVAEGAGCQLLEAPTLICEPSCGAGQTCSSEGCVTFPQNLDVGAVTLEGLEVPLEMRPSARNSYSNPVSAMLPHPGVLPGRDVVLRAEGGSLEPFTLLGTGITPLQVSDRAPLLANGADTVVGWTPSTESGVARLQLLLAIDNHGSGRYRIVCDTEDDGEHAIPSDLIERLMQGGVSGFPTLTLRRQTVDSVVLAPGCVQFVVGSELTIPVEVEGLISCNPNIAAEVCPEGQGCRADLTCG